MEWESQTLKNGGPCAVLRDGDRIIAKVYLSTDKTMLRIVLPEWNDLNAVTLNYPQRIVDFKRIDAPSRNPARNPARDSAREEHFK